MGRVKIDNMAKFYALMLLYEKNRHGYDLIKNIGEKMEKRISPGQIYPFLKELRKNKVIEAKKEGLREKTVYALTKSGKKFVKDMLFRFSDMISIAISKDLSQCKHCSCNVYKGGYRERGQIFCCRSCASAFRSE